MREDEKDLRCLDMARRLCQTEETIRQLAKHFHISKSLAHRELTTRLKSLDLSLYEQVRALLLYHKSVRHIRGGEATRLRYLQKKGNQVVM